MSFPINQEQIFQATNGGLELIYRFLPQAKLNKHFKIRKEGTESANISKLNGIYFVKDWGDIGGFFEKSKHGIHIYSHFTGNTYFESLLELGKELGLISDNYVGEKIFTKCKLHEFKGKLNSDGFAFETKDFSDFELDSLGQLVTPEVCKKYNLYALKSYSWVKKDSNVQEDLQDVYTVSSTETYPIFGIINKQGYKPKITLDGPFKKVNVSKEDMEDNVWIKIIQPKSSDKKYRFMYLGKKPSQYIFGLDNLKYLYNTLQIQQEEDEEGMRQTAKLERVVICSGDRDAINMASTGEAVVWFNSEVMPITDVEINLLKKYAEEVINVPDLDSTGYEAGKKLALEHLEIKTAWLPSYLRERKDFRGNPMKDFTDFIKINSSFDDKNQTKLRIQVKRLLELARPGKFWIEKYKTNKEGKRIGTINYSVNYKNAFNFLKLNGFYKIKEITRKEGYYYVKQDGHVVKEVDAQEIKDFFNRFLDKKQKEKGLRYFPDELLNMIIGSEAVSDKKLVNLEEKEFDFTDYTSDSQFFFFDKFIWKVTKDGIEEITKGYDRYVKEHDILNFIIKQRTFIEVDSNKINIEKPFFTIDKDKHGNLDIKILRNDCDFMNFLINGSRSFWKKEFESSQFMDVNEFMSENKFKIESELLSPEENLEQKLHLINKIYSFGYMLHRYKDPSKAWCVYVMDNEVVDDSESHGRTGKSLLWNNAIRLFMNSKYIGARKQKVVESEFIYDGITPETDYVLFDDADKRFNFQNLFTDVSGDLTVNPKNANAYLIPFFDSPKFCITTNYAPFGLDTSTTDRLLFNAFADWYHGESDEYPQRKPTDDFENMFFTEWNSEQYNLFLNFAMQCLQFFLSCKIKMSAPSGNIRKRNLITEMGVTFLEWANEYFGEQNLNRRLIKKEIYEHYKLMCKSINLRPSNANSFKRKLKQYCEYNDYVFCPKEMINDVRHNRIVAKINGQTEEMIFFATQSENEELI